MNEMFENKHQKKTWSKIHTLALPLIYEFYNDYFVVGSHLKYFKLNSTFRRQRNVNR